MIEFFVLLDQFFVCAGPGAQTFDPNYTNVNKMSNNCLPAQKNLAQSSLSYE